MAGQQYLRLRHSALHLEGCNGRQFFQLASRLQLGIPPGRRSLRRTHRLPHHIHIAVARIDPVMLYRYGLNRRGDSIDSRAGLRIQKRTSEARRVARPYPRSQYWYRWWRGRPCSPPAARVSSHPPRNLKASCILPPCRAWISVKFPPPNTNSPVLCDLTFPLCVSPTGEPVRRSVSWHLHVLCFGSS